MLELEHKSPHISKAYFQNSHPFQELVIEGQAELDCFTLTNGDVVKKGSETLIIPKLIRVNPTLECQSKFKEFEKKIALIDPNLPSSQKIRVLGNLGWINLKLLPSKIEAP